MNGGDKAVNLLKVIRGTKGDGEAAGLRIARVVTSEPDPITFVFEGTNQAVDLDVFEVPVRLYPLRVGDRCLAYPLIDSGAATRYGIVDKINGGLTLAVMQSADSLKINGIAKVYTAGSLMIPPFFLVGNASSVHADSDEYLLAANARALKAGDLVSVEPVEINNEDGVTTTIKYVVTQLVKGAE